MRMNMPEVSGQNLQAVGSLLKKTQAKKYISKFFHYKWCILILIIIKICFKADSKWRSI